MLIDLKTTKEKEHYIKEIYKLIENNNAQFIYQTLAKSGILVRKFNGQKNWLRIGLPGIKSEWLRLEAILHDCSNAINDMSK